MTVSATALVALSQAIERVDQAAEGFRKATQPSAGDDDHVDLSTEAVRLLVANNGYDAAIELAKTADEIANERLICWPKCVHPKPLHQRPRTAAKSRFGNRHRRSGPHPRSGVHNL
jgi:hypothetical protein